MSLNKPKLKIGDSIPNFSLPDQFGNMINISDFFGKNCLVIYFYPGDFTPVCTAEACAFRDSYDVFTENGAKVIGISSDVPEKHKKFISKYKLPFTLLSDKKNVARNLFGVPSTIGILPGRVTYIIDKNGIIKYIFSSQFNFKKHINKSIEFIKALSSS